MINSLFIIRHMRAGASLAMVLVLLAGVAWAQDQRRVTLMAYNVENLFDTQDNPAREGDNTYLPLSQKGTPEHVALCERNNRKSSRFPVWSMTPRLGHRCAITRRCNDERRDPPTPV
jgi:hypothetical protein